MSGLPNPVSVAPLIKFGRWSLLSVGVLYGAYHNSRLSRKAIKDREIEAKKKEIRDVQLAIEKKRLAEEENKAIAAL